MRVTTLILCFLFLISESKSDTIQLTHKFASENEKYIISLLLKALEYSIPNEFSLNTFPENLPKERMLSLVETKDIDVFWMASNKELEERFTSIKVPLYKGLFGYRIFLIRQDQQYQFNDVHTLEQLARLSAGLGTFWADTKILKASNLKVETTTKYVNLFHMLEGGRFDYFPRGLHEPWGELEQEGRSELTVEDNLMLVYPMPVYFFVSNSNQFLAQNIRNGLWALVRTGEFDDMFHNNPLVSGAIQRAKPSLRRIIRLPNNNLPGDTPFDDKRLWFNPNQETVNYEDN